MAKSRPKLKFLGVGDGVHENEQTAYSRIKWARNSDSGPGAFLFRVAKDNERFKLSIEPFAGDVFTGSGIDPISFGEVDDRRIRNTLIKAHDQFIDIGIPFIVLAQVADAAGIKNALGKAERLIEDDKKISKFAEIMIVHKTKKGGPGILSAPELASRAEGLHPGYAYSVYPIMNKKTEHEHLLQCHNGLFIVK